MKCELWSGVVDTALVRKAISVTDLETSGDGKTSGDPSWYFPPKTLGLKKVGEIEIIGDDHLVDDCFTVNAF